MVARYVMQKITWAMIVLGMLLLNQGVQNVGGYIKLKIVV
jgi:hypothetical protein